MREIHKLLLNTLYGRMGMNEIREVTKIVSTEQAENNIWISQCYR